jgi:hypothetical protein
MLKVVGIVGVCLALVGCGAGSSSSGTTTAPRPHPPTAVAVQRKLEADYKLRNARCEADVHGGQVGRFVCLAVARRLPLRLRVTQARARERPVVNSCEGVQQIRGKSFVTCSFGAPDKG